MNLTLHIFRKDIRQFRILLAVWFVLLLIHLGVDLGWVGAVTYNSRDGFSQAANVWTELLPGVVYLLIVVLPSFVVLTDSPARRGGFLATRPVVKSDLALAKLIFIVGLIIVPFALIELVHLVSAGLPGWVVERGTLERLAMVTALGLGFAAYATLWPDLARLARSVGILLVLYIAIGMTYTLLMLLPGSQLGKYAGKLFSGLPHYLVIWNVLAFFMVLFACWHIRTYRSVFVRWSGLVMVGILTLVCLKLWPKNVFALQPADPAAAKSMASQVGFTISPLDFEIAKMPNPRDQAIRASIWVSPQSDPLPGTRTLEWASENIRLADTNGDDVPGSHASHSGSALFNQFQGRLPVNHRDFAALAADFPADILFWQNSFSSYNPGNQSVDGFDLPVTPAEMESPLIAHEGLVGRVYQWNRIADLPLTNGATARDEFGAWEFAGINEEHGDISTANVYLHRRQIELNTARDSRCSDRDGGPLARMVFMLYDPVTHIALLPEPNHYNTTARSTDTAWQQLYQDLIFHDRKSFSSAELARLRLIIYQKTWLGMVHQEWQSPVFTFNHMFLPVVPPENNSGEPMLRGEFERRFATLKAPAPDAARPEISRYLLDFLRLVDARRMPLDLEDPHLLQLAAYVPGQLDTLIESLPVMSFPSRQSVINAMVLGVTEEQKPVILAALPREPELIQVIVARGWLAEARPQVLQLTQYCHRLPAKAVEAIASFHDPDTYPRLLDEFAHSDDPELVPVLQSLPGLEPALKKSVERKWRQTSLTYSRWNSSDMFRVPFMAAARCGDPSTLQRLYLFLPDAEGLSENIDFTLADAARDAIWMPNAYAPGISEYHLIFDFLHQHRPEDFVFSPGLHRFVLKSIVRGGDTAANRP